MMTRPIGEMVTDIHNRAAALRRRKLRLRALASVGCLAVVSAYRVDVEREGAWWIVQIDPLGITTQARRLADVERNAREAVTAWCELPSLDDFDMVMTVHD